MADNGDKKNGKKTVMKFSCIKCNFNTSQNSDYERHLMTPKHKRLIQGDKKTGKNRQSINEFVCICGKSYKQRQGLYKHSKKCTYIEEEEEEKEIVEEKKEEGPDYKELLILAMTQMQEQQTHMQEQQTHMQRKDDLVSELVTQNNELVTQNNELVTKMTDMIPKMREFLNNIL
jgi:uncharacterized Zn-finger protein